MAARNVDSAGSGGLRNPIRDHREGSSPTISHRRIYGSDAPICQDIPLGGTRDGLARAEVCHDTVVDLAGEEAFETPDDLASGPTVRGPSRDVVEGRLVVPHADDDGAIEAALAASAESAWVASLSFDCRRRVSAGEQVPGDG